MATRTRRSAEEVNALGVQARALIDAGQKARDVYKTVGLAESVYRRWAKLNPKKPGEGTRGTVNVASLPPRPKKGTKRAPKPLDRTDISAVANRIARLDKKLHSIDDMVKERIELVGVLVKLLKAK